jgi:hypothetical protein
MADEEELAHNRLILGLFPPRRYNNESIDKLYKFSQETELNGYITFDYIDNGQSLPATFNFNRFRELVTLACILHLQKQTNVVVTEVVTVIGNYYREKLYQQNLGLPGTNTRYVGSITSQQLKTQVQTIGQQYIKKINTIDNDIIKDRYQQNLHDQIEAFKYLNEKQKKEPSFLFTNDSKESFVQKYRAIFQHAIAPENLIVIMPIKLTPFMTDIYEMNSHAQYCIIDRARKTYMIVDGQYDGADKNYKNMLFTEALKLDPFIQEITGEEYAPYFYSIQCPQSVVKDRNCIWWSLMILYMYIQSDQTTVDLRVLLRKIQSIGGATEYVQALNAFKVYVVEDILKPMIQSGNLHMSHKYYTVGKLLDKLRIVQEGTGRRRATRRQRRHRGTKRRYR